MVPVGFCSAGNMLERGLLAQYIYGTAIEQKRNGQGQIGQS